MDLVKISQQQGKVPVTVFHIQDRINLGNYKMLEQTAKNAYESGTRNLIIDLRVRVTDQYRDPGACGHS